MPNLKISALTGGGAAQAGDEYVVARSGGNNKITGANVAAAATSVGTLTSLTVSGQIGTGNGTVGAPSLAASADTNTGIYFPAADTIGFVEGGVESMRLDASGNLGLGVTPSAWGNRKAFQISGGAVYTGDGSTDTIGVMQNGYNDGSGWKYVNAGFASRYYQNGSGHYWDIAPSGAAAGNPITFTQAMTLDASGNLLLGVTATDTAGVSMANSLNYSIKESSGSLANLFRQASSAATVLANGYKQSANANAFASSIGSSWAKSAISMDSGVIKFFTDTAATTAIGTDVTPTERAQITSGGSLVIGTAALATTATDGFLYVPTCAGTPTGTPTTQTGTAPIVVDTTNHKLYFFSGGTWRDAGP